MLINSLLAHATDTWWEVFISQLERLNTRKAIIVSPVVPCGATYAHGHPYPAPDELAHS
jgi:hypothetical protein